ncbi:hypothetical protein BY458DRAFT_524748 [Sporodiniella umbellata]|nr:hypothetical protein BY458DRAFT_524748 [Sporodiniella umbellata]
MQINSAYHHKNVWRSPGFCHIPDILGSAYLKPEAPAPLDLRPLDLSKQISKRPWYPPNPHDEIPPLPPINRSKTTHMRKSS